MVASDRGLERAALRVTGTLELPRVLGETTRALVRELDAALARVWLVEHDADGDVLVLLASAGLSERLDGSRSRVRVGELKIGEIAARRVPLTTTSLQDARFADQAWIAEHALASFSGYPLIVDGELFGVLAMFSMRVLTADEQTRLGVFAEQAAIAIKNAGVLHKARGQIERLEADLRGAHAIVGRSPALAHALDYAQRAAKTNSTVLLVGETGTGKELFARAIHDASDRKNGPLVSVNCAAIPAGLFESEMFGHEKGAFTGATSRRVGRFELAHRGTLFLDEVGELPLEAQAKLLRVLEAREIERVGGSRPVRVDVRVIAATNRDLESLVARGTFRADLHYRLNVFQIVVPPLRARRGDIALLADAFLGPRRSLDADALAYLEDYEFPGNVRELQNVLERASILAPGPQITLRDLPELTNPSAPAPLAAPWDEGKPLKQRVDAFEKSLIATALDQAKGNQSEAARLLRTSRATLQYKMKLYGL